MYVRKKIIYFTKNELKLFLFENRAVGNIDTFNLKLTG